MALVFHVAKSEQILSSTLIKNFFKFLISYSFRVSKYGFFPGVLWTWCSIFLLTNLDNP